MTEIVTGSSDFVVPLSKPRSDTTDITYCATERARAVEEDTTQYSTTALLYKRLTVGDAKEKDMIMIKKNHAIEFKKATLCLLSSNHEYDIEYAVIEGVTYLKSLKKYESYEFDSVFGFGCDCHDFVEGKIVVVRPSPSSF